MTANDTELVKKKKALRHNEYYAMQSVFDKIYSSSKKGHNFNNLMDSITSENNILLAYRNIKRNDGSMTKGTNNTTIEDIAKMPPDELVKMVKNRLKCFYPHSVRRVEIPKEDGTGRMRPLGIPTMEDRIIQQCIQQVLEPICEAKFYEHSYGFRPNRSQENAIARMVHLINMGYCYVVDIDIAGFFDNVNHGKLLKQLWTLGIRDQKLIKIISLMLKAEIEGEGIPDKGVPQGGVISPLLSNVVLNELDWWIANQWENFPTRYKYRQRGSKHRAMMKTKLKEMWIVRFADDFKILCKSHKNAHKIFKATKMWLKERLNLDINTDKSKITNLKKNHSNFLGIKIKVRKGKGKKHTGRSHIVDKAMVKAKETIKDKIRILQRNPTVENAHKYNATVLSLQNYYKMATMVNLDFAEIAYIVNKSLRCRTKKICSDKGEDSPVYKKYYGKYNYKKIYVAGIALFPIDAIRFEIPKGFSQETCSYTAEGRAKIHTNLRFDTNIMTYLMSNPTQGETTAYNDNRISLYAGQLGRCHVTGQHLRIGSMEVHHVIPRKLGGGDEYKNLKYVTKWVHELIHATVPETIEFYKNMLKLNEAGLKKLNKLRSKVGNDRLQVN